MRKYHGLHAVLAEMPERDRHNGLYVEVCYDLDNDEVLAEVYVDFGEGTRTIYDNSRIVRIGNFVRRVSAAKLKEYIDEVADFYI